MSRSVKTNDPRYNDDIEIKRYFDTVKDEIDTNKIAGEGGFNKISIDKQKKVLIRSGEGQNKNLDFNLNAAFTRALLQAIGNQVAKQISPEAQSMIKPEVENKIIFNENGEVSKQQYEKLFIPFFEHKKLSINQQKDNLYQCFYDATQLYNPNLFLFHVRKNKDKNTYDYQCKKYYYRFCDNFLYNLQREDQKKMFEVISKLLADQVLLALPDRKYDNMAIDKNLNAIHIDLDGYHIGGQGKNAKFSKLFSDTNYFFNLKSNHLSDVVKLVLKHLTINDKNFKRNNEKEIAINLRNNILYKSFNKKYDNLQKSFKEGKLLDLIIKEAIIYKDENLSDEEFAQKIQENLSEMLGKMELYYLNLLSSVMSQNTPDDDQSLPNDETKVNKNDFKRTVMCIPEGDRYNVFSNLINQINSFRKKYLDINEIKNNYLKQKQEQKRTEFLVNIPGKDVLLTKKASSKDYEDNVKKDINIENMLIQYKKDNEKENNLKYQREMEQKTKAGAQVNNFFPEKNNENKFTINENKKKLNQSDLPLQQTNAYENNDDFAGIKFKLKKKGKGKKLPVPKLLHRVEENQQKQNEQSVKMMKNEQIQEDINKIEKEKVGINIDNSMFHTKINFRKPTFLNNLKFNKLNQCYNKQMAKNNNNVPDFNIHQSRYNSVFHNFC